MLLLQTVYPFTPHRRPKFQVKRQCIGSYSDRRPDIACDIIDWCGGHKLGNVHRVVVTRVSMEDPTVGTMVYPIGEPSNHPGILDT